MLSAILYPNIKNFINTSFNSSSTTAEAYLMARNHHLVPKCYYMRPSFQTKLLHYGVQFIQVLYMDTLDFPSHLSIKETARSMCIIAGQNRIPFSGYRPKTQNFTQRVSQLCTIHTAVGRPYGLQLLQTIIIFIKVSWKLF